ncbi:DUF2306 domain-containing protein [Brevibacterium picturae]
MTTMFIAIHALAASGVVLLAPVQIIRRTKDRKHRWIGRSWVVLMYLVCVSGMFIYTLSGSFTIFHALAIFTFGTTTVGVIAIRRGNIRRHIGMMIGSWLGALTAGAFAAIIPGREIPQLAVADPGLLWGAVAAIVIAATVWVGYVLKFVPTQARSSSNSGFLRKNSMT